MYLSSFFSPAGDMQYTVLQFIIIYGNRDLLHDVLGSVYGLSFNFHKQWVTVVRFILPLPIEAVPGKVTQEKEFQNCQCSSTFQRMGTNHSTHLYWYGKVLNIPHNSSDMHALQSIKERDGSKT